MRRPKPGTLWLEPLDAWCGPGASRGRHAHTVGSYEPWPVAARHFVRTACAPSCLFGAAESESGCGIPLGWGIVIYEQEKPKRLGHQSEWVPVALRQDGAPVNEFRTESMRLDTSPILADARAYFEEALAETPIEDTSGRLLFERWDDLHWGVSWRRGILSCLDGVLYLDWLTNDDFGLSEVREFFEAPFFDALQTRLWYTWLAEGGWHEAMVRGRRMGMSVRARGHVVHLRLYW